MSTVAVQVVPWICFQCRIGLHWINLISPWHNTNNKTHRNSYLIQTFKVLQQQDTHQSSTIHLVLFWEGMIFAHPYHGIPPISNIHTKAKHILSLYFSHIQIDIRASSSPPHPGSTSKSLSSSSYFFPPLCYPQSLQPLPLHQTHHDFCLWFFSIIFFTIVTTGELMVVLGGGGVNFDCSSE